MITARPPNDEPRREPGYRPKRTIEHGLFSLLSNTAGAIFWWAEQRRWQIADRLEELELQR
jgi:hypothetical protein